MRKLVALAVGFGCMIGYVRLVSLGFVGYLEQGAVESADSWYLLRACAMLVALAALSIWGLFGRKRLNALFIMAATACAVAAPMLFAIGGASTLGPVIAVLEGAASATLMYAWMLVLSRQPMQSIIGACALGGGIAGLMIAGVPRLDDSMALVIAVVSAFAAGSALLLADRGLESLQPDGVPTKSELTRVPWVAVVMVLACGFLGTTVYGIAVRLAWLHDWSPDYVAFGLAILTVVVATLAIMLLSRNWMHVVWVPITALLAVALGFACVSMRESMQIALGLVLASVFCGHFLHWMVFPAMFSTLRIPRAFMAGMILVLANGSLATMAGNALGAVLPRSMQNLGGVAGIVVLTLVVLFAVTSVSYRRAFGVMGSGDVNRGSPSDLLATRVETHSSEYGLTPREIEVALLTAQGFSCAYIAEKLVVSNSTVRFHQQNLYRKFDVHSRNEFIEFFLNDEQSDQAKQKD